MASRTFTSCIDCFYRYRGSPADISAYCSQGHSAERVDVCWNYDQEFYETTYVRDPPNGWTQQWRGNVVRLCDPSKGTCRRNNCIFAHGVKEQRKWNMILQQHRKSSRPTDGAPFRRDSTRAAQPRRSIQPPSPNVLIQHQVSSVKSISSQIHPPINNFHSAGNVASGVQGDSAICSEKFEDRVQSELTLESIKVELTKVVYKDKFHNLICWEEKRHIEILNDKCNSMCKIKLYPAHFPPKWIRSVKVGKRFGCIEGLNQDQIAYSTQASEAVFVANATHEVRMEILKENFNHCDENLYIAFNEKNEAFLSQISAQQIRRGETDLVNIWIEFEVKHSYFNSLIKAINYLKPEIIERLLPSKEMFLPFSPISYEELQYMMPRPPCSLQMSLDEDQRFSLVRILTCNSVSPPLLINGSFGTGKTRLLAVACHCLIMQGRMKKKPVRILICAHHPATVDAMVQHYFGRMLKQYPENFELVRLISRNRILPKHEFKKYYQSNVELSPDFRQVPYVIVATTHLTSPSLHYKCGNKFFTHILMDEGSQTREPEAISPLCLASPSTKLVIAGDSCQVGPALLVLGEEAHENGLKYSLLERLCKLYRSEDLAHAAQHYMLNLNINYRCHADIMRLPNSLFYSNRIIPYPIDALSHPMAPYPFIFVCSSLDYEVEPWVEARVLLNHLQELVIKNWPDTWGSRDLSDVSLITASRTQLVRITRVARSEHHEDMRLIAKFPSYAIQGREFRAIFISTTEPLDDYGRTTNPTKSLCDNYVFNTVLTRSKSLVVAAGSPYALLCTEQQMEGNICWRNYIGHCIEHSTFFIPPQVEPNNNIRSKFFVELKAKLHKSIYDTYDVSFQHGNTPTFKDLPNSKALPLSSSVDQNPAVSQLKLQNFSASANQGEIVSVKPPLSVPVPASSQVTSKPPDQKSRKSQRQASVQKNTSVPRSKLQNVTNGRVNPSIKPPLPIPAVSASSQVMSKPSEQKSRNTQVPASVQNNTSVQKHNSSQTEAYAEERVKSAQNTSIISKVAKELVPRHSYQKKIINPGRNGKNHHTAGQSSGNKFNFSEESFPTLESASKVTNKALKELKTKESIKNTRVVLPQSLSRDCLKYKNELESGISILEEDLTPDNYKEKFHHLLCWEELEHDRQLSQLCDGLYTVYMYKRKFIPDNLAYDHHGEKFVRFGYITSDNGDILSHIKLSSQGAFIIFKNNICYVHAKLVHARIPKSAHQSAITIGFSEEEHKKIEQFEMFKLNDFDFTANIKFELKHFYFQQLHKAIDCLPKNVICKLTPAMEQLLGEDQKTSIKSSWPNYERLYLDKMQLKALHVILNSTPKLPILVAGPFGTGKTRMLARAAYDILKKRQTRVLICAHHNVSADTFVGYFGPMIKDEVNPWHIDMVRIVPNKSYNVRNYQRYEEFFKTANNISWQQIRTKRIIITTLGTVLKLRDKIPRERWNNFFSDILIDEGAQTREPEMVSPLAFAGESTRIVIAGDHCQVGPRLLVLGDNAQKYGLGVSLLERMHSIYDKFDLPLNIYSVTLLTNYRCHSGILMLPSSLFYQSTLQCRVPDLESHPDAPFPLAFVCSSMEENLANISGINKVEAEVLVEEYNKYFKKWPRNWSSEEKICIMSPSANQCSELRNRFWKRHSIEILKAYEIQGTEFKAIFLSTSEPTLENGKCKYDTKSISDRYVFNTAITRSKSLVVAVGNPFLLLELENQMVKKYGEDARCWTPYIRQCIECNTFSYSERLRKESIKSQSDKLLNKIYNTSLSKSYVSLKPLDSIIKAYKKVFEELKECKNAKLLLSSSRGARLSWKMEDYEGESESEESIDQSCLIKGTYKCILDIYKYRKAKAIPIDSSRQIVKIRGLKNRRGAFDRDTVMVGVFEDSPQGKCYGQVREVLKRGSNLKFICKVSNMNPILFYPIDEKNPVLVNLPRLSKELLGKKETEDINEFDLKSKDVVVFKMSPEMENEEIEDVPLPQIKQVIPLSVAKNMLFLVSFVKWDPKYRYPLGIVENVFPKGFTRFNSERLLTIQHSIDYNDDNVGSELLACSSVQEDKTVQFFSQIFTIDPEGAQNLDDGLSITKHHNDDNGQAVYQLGVHITNAAKYIEVGTDVDMAGKALGVSVYGGSKGKVMHMLSSHTLRSQLSLTPGKIKDVISVTCFFTMDPLNPREMTVHSVDIKPAQVKSCMQLTYASAQQILEGKIPKDFVEAAKLFTSIPLCSSMKLLYDIAFAIRVRRMQSDAAYAYDVSDPGEESCWQAHLLVEELMIWANSEVAKQIHSYYPDAALLRRQSPPNLDKVHEILRENMPVMINSLSLSRYLNSEMEVQPSSLLVPIDVLQKLELALQEDDLTKLAYYLTTNKCYPQLAAVESELHSISLPAEYCCSEVSKQNSLEYQHSGLNLDEYTHFSSPMRRYFDIQVQRVLLQTFEMSPVEFSHEQHKELCVLLNTKMQNSKLFEKKVNRVDLSFEFLSSSKVCSAFIVKYKSRYIELGFPHLKFKYFPKKSLKISVSRISLSFSIVSLKHSNMATVMSSKHVIVSPASPSTSNGELKAFFTETGSSEAKRVEQKYSVLSVAQYSLFFESLGTEIPYDQWKEALELIKTPTPSLTPEEKLKLIRTCKSPSILNTTATGQDKKWLYVECEIKNPWKSPGILKVWLSWSMRDHIISPIVQLVEVSPLVRFCIQHCNRPAECFSDPNLLHASRNTYKSVDEYIDLWKRVLLAEAAEKSVNEKGSKPVVLRDVSLVWPELTVPKECIDEWYYIPNDTVKIIIPRSFVDECSELFSITTGYFVCVRCDNDSISGTKAVFHFVVHHVEEDPKEEKERVIFVRNIGDNNCRISEAMKKMLDSKEWNYEVQIIPMSVSYRKVFAGLLRLWNPKVSSELSRSVAVNIRHLSGLNKYPMDQLKPILDGELATSISKWSTKLSKKTVSINEGQNDAINLALKRPFQLIQGPPGTGKSVTGAHIAYILAKLNQCYLNKKDIHKCVFYCGPSNKSVDVVLEKFSELLMRNSHLQESLKILRIYSSSVERKHYPDPSNKPSSPSTAECPEWAKKFALHHLLRDNDNCREISELKALREVEEKVSQIKSENKLPSGFLIKKHKEALKNATEVFLESNKFDIVFCTCNEASGQRAQIFPVRQCIIDESGMAYEPETIAPLRLCEHAVLIGDHKQLQPVIDYGPAKKCGLSVSLFERYAVEYGKTYTRTLRTQYRMHEEICRFPSMHFYDSELETDASVLARTNPETRIEGFWPRGPNMPIVFVNLLGEEVGMESKSNTMEAKKVVEIAKLLHNKYKVPVTELAVLTPYTSQKDIIKKIVKQGPKYLENLLVASINESQGNEFGIVILSTVRSQPIAKIRNKYIIQADHIWLRENLGFITDKHQINVGITRSKYGLVIIGNRMLLSYDDTWKELLYHYEERGCIVEGNKFPPH